MLPGKVQTIDWKRKGGMSETQLWTVIWWIWMDIAGHASKQASERASKHYDIKGHVHVGRGLASTRLVWYRYEKRWRCRYSSDL